ncbi:hypothetical protein EMCRGX_G018049 [Ephydatia muelleri]
MQRDLAVTVIQMMIPVRQKKKGRTVCKEKRAIKTRKKHIIGLLMAENVVEIDRLSVNPAVNAYTGITELKILGGQLDPSSCLSMSVMSNMYVKPGQPIACDECMSA